MIDRILGALSPMFLLFTCVLAVSTMKIEYFLVVAIWMWNCACHTPIFVSKKHGKAK